MSNTVWREIHNFSSGAVCLVLASRPYERPTTSATTTRSLPTSVAGGSVSEVVRNASGQYSSGSSKIAVIEALVQVPAVSWYLLDMRTYRNLLLVVAVAAAVLVHASAAMAAAPSFVDPAAITGTSGVGEMLTCDANVMADPAADVTFELEVRIVHIAGSWVDVRRPVQRSGCHRVVHDHRDGSGGRRHRVHSCRRDGHPVSLHRGTTRWHPLRWTGRRTSTMTRRCERCVLPVERHIGGGIGHDVRVAREHLAHAGCGQ